MKRIIQLLAAVLLLIFACSAYAQAPQKFNYQAVVRDGSGNVIANNAVGIRVSIHEGSANGTVVYQETQTATTNQFGLITLQIGAGNATNAAFTSVDWSKKAKYIQMEIDAGGGTNYTDIGATELISVPYALYAENAGGSVSSKDSVPAGTSGQTLRHDGTKWTANSFLYNNGTRLGIGTASPLCRLHISDGALMVTGTIGSTPISGAGTRFMWIPPKKALRAGTVSGNQWDDANLGLNSTSVGEDNIASGAYSVAFGRQDSATGSNSTAIGFRNVASNTGAAAFGGNNKATGYYSFAAGNMNNPSGQYTAAFGYSNMASADYAVAMGKTTVASGQYSLALGYLTQASGNYSFAQGKSTTASGVYSMASGEGSAAGKNNCISFGYYTTANGMYSMATGLYTYARAYASTVSGRYNIISGDSSAWLNSDPLFVIGNGAGSTSRSNAFTVLKNGNAGILDDTPASALTVGSGDLFQVSSTGDIVRIKNVPYVWPSTQGTLATFLRNDGNGNLSWAAATGPAGPTGATGATGSGNLSGTVNYIPKFTASASVGNSAIYQSGNNVGIGTTAPAAYLDISGTSNGFLMPRLSTVQRNAIVSPAPALQIYNTTTNCIEIYMGNAWQNIFCGCAAPPATPAAGAAPTTSVYGTTWKWNTVPLAKGYKWNSVNNYGTAIDNGTSVTYYQSPFSCNYPNTSYVWAYNDCGNSTALVLTDTTNVILKAPVANKPTTYSSGYTNWSWKPVYMAKGYKWNTVNNYATAIDKGTSTYHTQSPYVCNNPNVSYVWAYNDCGSSPVTVMTDTTNVILKAPVANTPSTNSNGTYWSWKTVYMAQGYKWNTVNNYATATDKGTSLYHTQSPYGCNHPNVSYVWAYNFCGSSPVTILTDSTIVVPQTPVESTHQTYQNSIRWYWNTAPFMKYKWNSINDYSTAIDRGTYNYYVQDTLSCSTSYTSYVWAYNNCGVSQPLMMDTVAGFTSTPIFDTAIITASSIRIYWNPMSSASGYKWNYINDFSTSYNGGSYSINIDTLICNTTYTIYVWAYNNCMHSANPLVVTATTSACKCGGATSITDSRDGKVYNIIDIGSQCWMKENMNIGAKINGGVNQTNNSIIEKYCYNDSVANCNVYGGLYRWAEALQYFSGATDSANYTISPPGNIQGICPAGWHVPSGSEFYTLSCYLGGYNSGGNMKETGTTHWLSPNYGATNSSGFTALGAGYYEYNNLFKDKKSKVYFWTTDIISGGVIPYSSKYYSLRYNDDDFLNLNSFKTSGLSVRCLKD